MLSFLPVILLLLSAAAIQVVRRMTKRAGSTWLMAMIFGSVTWLSMILVGVLLPPAVKIDNWLSLPHQFTAITFQLTRETWVLGFLLVSLLQAIILFNSRYIDTPNFLNKITGSMLLTAFGLMAVLARTPLAFVLTWSLMDLAEFGVLTITLDQSLQARSSFAAVLLRELGIVLLVLLMAVSPEQNLRPGDMTPTLIAWLLGLIFLLRLGILPILPDQEDDSRLRRGFRTLLRTLPFVTAIAFASIFPGLTLAEKGSQIALPALSFAGLLAAILWFFSPDELSGRPYWFFANGLLGLLAFLVNKVEALPGIAVIAVSAGSGLFLYSPKTLKRLAFLPFLLVGLLALPFTPTVGILSLFAPEIFRFNQVLAVTTYALLLAGVLKHGFSQEDDSSLVEPWTRLFHHFALYFIALSPWVIVGLTGSLVRLQANWWLSGSVLVLMGFFFGADYFYKRRFSIQQPRPNMVLTFFNKILKIVDQIFSLTWLMKLFTAFGSILSSAVNIFVRVLEGDGGVLWSFLFLVLLVSLMITRQVP